MYGWMDTHTHTALQAFRDKHSRDPSHHSPANPTDEEILLKLREKVATKFGIPKDIIPEELSRWVYCLIRKTCCYGNILFLVRYCFSELSPVCAIVGGVLGQEIIKVLSPSPPLFLPPSLPL